MIRFEHVTKRYRGAAAPALDDVTFNIARGEFVFLVGPSGSGKSSCLRLILREEVPSSGDVLALGRDTSTLSNRRTPFFRRNIGSVFQDFRLLPAKNVFQNVAFALQVIGASRAMVKQAVPEALDRVGLKDKAKRMPHELSGGEQQRVAIARALVNSPQVMLADEPTGNLDPKTSADIMDLLALINEGGTTIVMATHEAAIVDRMRRRVIELADGRVVRDEATGGYGDSSALQRIRMQTEKGAESTAALTAVQAAQREAEERMSDGADAAPIGGAEAALGEPAEAASSSPASIAEPEPTAAPEPPEPVPGTEPGVADRLGLTGDDQEVGPTS
ncbi:cell division ATP-binding protein FtsE [Microbacterium halophytorum]|uniref:cell division ATP-binding protein FtsE n=1 Tax=Microbacterium halophytorum TaxID=2067568 RepID=UPI000CFA92B5|nr:cell division ATP-binding protein FtsE [Microbacterium halophytorum]